MGRVHTRLALLFLFRLSMADGQQLIPLDAGSSVTFKIKNFGLTVEGSLSGIQGSIVFDPEEPVNSRFAIAAQSNSVSTGIDLRDRHLRNEEYFNGQKYPEISFHSSEIRATGKGFHVKGSLTIKGITRDIAFDFSAEQSADGILFKGDFQINRLDFKVGGKSLSMQDIIVVNFKIKAKPKAING